MRQLDEREIRLITSITQEQLKPLDPTCRTVVLNLSAPVANAEYALVAELLKERPDVMFMIQSVPDLRLDFLKFFPFLRRVLIGLYELESLDGLTYLADSLEDLQICGTKKKLSLRFLEQLKLLKRLYMEGQTKHFDSVGLLERLVWLDLRSTTLENVSSLIPLRNLRKLEFTLGNTTNLSHLPELPELRYLGLTQVSQLRDLSFVSELTELRYLLLHNLNKVETLPSFSKLSKLRWVYIESLKSVHCLAPITEAPSLEQIVFVNMPQLTPNDFEVFVGHPRLQSAAVGLCSHVKNEQAQQILGLSTDVQKRDPKRDSLDTFYTRNGEDILR